MEVARILRRERLEEMCCSTSIGRGSVLIRPTSSLLVNPSLFLLMYDSRSVRCVEGGGQTPSPAFKYHIARSVNADNIPRRNRPAQHVLPPLVGAHATRLGITKGRFVGRASRSFAAETERVLWGHAVYVGASTNRVRYAWSSVSRAHETLPKSTIPASRPT